MMLASSAIVWLPTGVRVPKLIRRQMTQWRSALSASLLGVPCKGTVDTSVEIRPGQLSLRPEAQGAVQEVTNGLKHFLKRPRRRSAGSAGRNVSEH